MSELLSQILTISRELLEDTARRDWNAVEKKLVKRQTMLETFFSSPPIPEDIDAINDVMRALLNMDSQARELISRQHNETKEALNILQSGRAGTAVYQDVDNS